LCHDLKIVEQFFDLNASETPNISRGIHSAAASGPRQRLSPHPSAAIFDFFFALLLYFRSQR
jgi:hypothetical protein